MSLIATTALVLGAAKGIMNMWSNEVEREDTIAEYNTQLDYLKADKIRFKKNNEKDRKIALNAIDDQISANDRSLENTKEMQTSNLASGSMVASENSKVMNIEYAELLNSVKQNSGSATASAASSGFRMAASAMNTKKVVDRAGTSAINKFKVQSDLQNYSSYEDVRSNYENANNQIESFKQQKSILERKINETNDQFDRKFNEYNIEAARKKTYMDEQIEYLDGEGKWLSRIGGVVGTGADMLNAYAPYYTSKKTSTASAET